MKVTDYLLKHTYVHGKTTNSMYNVNCAPQKLCYANLPTNHTVTPLPILCNEMTAGQISEIRRNSFVLSGHAYTIGLTQYQLCQYNKAVSRLWKHLVILLIDKKYRGDNNDWTPIIYGPHDLQQCVQIPPSHTALHNVTRLHTCSLTTPYTCAVKQGQ